MKFIVTTLVGGELTVGLVEEWDWAKNDGGYTEGRDFFSIHWEVRHNYPCAIMFHVEAPRYEIDPELNTLKEDVITEILSSGILNKVTSKDYSLEIGRRINQSEIRRNKSTEAFRVVLKDASSPRDHEQDLLRVHDALGSHVEKIIDTARDRIMGVFR
ncbi:hypothetical protein [Geotalea sp. SG265]|uniref:hypothetical protein n=1 Tax=Geotalea sp. SG265 TaxID=2922867 RepID=UPI001FB02512|nr:hypothetical protein [Geotalea sp. SG265]